MEASQHLLTSNILYHLGYSKVQYSTVQYSTVQYINILSSTLINLPGKHFAGSDCYERKNQECIPLTLDSGHVHGRGNQSKVNPCLIFA